MAKKKSNGKLESTAKALGPPKSSSDAKPTPKKKVAKKAKAGTKKPASKKVAEKPKTSPPTTRPLSNAEIGTVAGEVWQSLYQNGEQPIASLKKSINASPDLILAAVGWLAREDKLDFHTKGRATKLTLR